MPTAGRAGAGTIDIEHSTTAPQEAGDILDGDEVRPSSLRPIFIFSGFRASSTWFWTKFRENPSVWAYYEIFHESLATARLGDLRAHPNPGWRSRHPRSDPYFLEFVPLARPGGGVEDFPAAATLAGDFVPVGGLAAPLEPAQKRYVDRLIATARARNRVPVLTCTRMLGRIAALRAASPGVHILLRRNLFQQWNSYSGQHRSGNLYFIDMLRLTLVNSGDDAFIAHLRERLPDEMRHGGEAWVRAEFYDEVFLSFAALHVYLLIHAARYADVIVDVNRLADPADDHRREVEAQIEALCGLHIELDDARDEIDMPWRPIADPQHAEVTLSGLVERACDALVASPPEQAEAAALLAALWRENTHFSKHSKVACESLAESHAAAAAASSEARLAWRQLAFHASRASRFEAAAATAAAVSRRLEARLELVTAELATARETAESGRRERDRLDQSLRQAEASNRMTVRDLKARERQTRAECSAAEASLRRAQGETARVDAALEALRAQTDALRTQLAAIEAERQRLREELTWPDAPPALRAVLPLAKLLARFRRPDRG
jgi:hypothetical protein